MARKKFEVNKIKIENSEFIDLKNELISSRFNVSNLTNDKNQPRQNWALYKTDEIDETIDEHGVLQSLLVRELDNPVLDEETGIYSNHIIVDGETRWRGAKKKESKIIEGILNLSAYQAEIGIIYRQLDTDRPLSGTVEISNLLPINENPEDDTVLIQNPINEIDINEDIKRSQSSEEPDNSYIGQAINDLKNINGITNNLNIYQRLLQILREECDEPLLESLSDEIETQVEKDKEKALNEIKELQRDTGIVSVPVLVIPRKSKVDPLVYQLILNIHRNKVNPLEEAKAVMRLVEQYDTMTLPEGVTPRAKAAKTMKKSETYVNRALALVDYPPELKKFSDEKGVNDLEALSAINGVIKLNSDAANELMAKYQKGEPVSELRKAAREAKRQFKAPRKNASSKSAITDKVLDVTLKKTLYGQKIVFSANNHNISLSFSPEAIEKLNTITDQLGEEA